MFKLEIKRVTENKKMTYVVYDIDDNVVEKDTFGYFDEFEFTMFYGNIVKNVSEKYRDLLVL